MQSDQQQPTIDPYSDEAQLNARFATQWYDGIASSVKKCVFCDLKAKYFIAETPHCVLTVNLFPYIDGHLMVIPKKHSEALAEVSAHEWADTQKLLTQGMDALRQRFAYTNFNILYREGGKEAGSSVKHVHIHILPVDGLLTYRQGGFDFNFQKLTQLPLKTAEDLRGILT